MNLWKCIFNIMFRSLFLWPHTVYTIICPIFKSFPSDDNNNEEIPKVKGRVWSTHLSSHILSATLISYSKKNAHKQPCASKSDQSGNLIILRGMQNFNQRLTTVMIPSFLLPFVPLAASALLCLHQCFCFTCSTLVCVRQSCCFFTPKKKSHCETLTHHTAVCMINIEGC